MKQRQEYILRAQAKLLEPERSAADKAMRLIQNTKKGWLSKVRAIDAVGLMIRASARGTHKAAADRKNDKAARILVGARIPRETAERYRAAAAAQGMSLYRWVCTALDTMYKGGLATLARAAEPPCPASGGAPAAHLKA